MWYKNSVGLGDQSKLLTARTASVDLIERRRNKSESSIKTILFVVLARIFLSYSPSSTQGSHSILVTMYGACFLAFVECDVCKWQPLHPFVQKAACISKRCVHKWRQTQKSL